MKKRDEEKEKDPYALKDIFVDMEMDLVLSFKRNLIKHHTDEINKGFSWEMWQVAMLRNIEEYRKENQQIIGKYRPAVKAAVDDVLNYKYEEGQRNVEKQTRRTKQNQTQEPETGQIDMDHGSFSLPENDRNTGKVGNTPPKETQFFGMNKKKLNALISSTQKDMEDVSQAVYRKMDDVYRQTIYKAVIQLNSGAISLNKAIDKATEEFLGKGIDSVVYKNGRHVNIATYAEMALRTASQRATFLGEGTKRDEYGNHLIVVSTHPNCCKLCYPWQGQILIDDVFSHPSEEYIVKYRRKYKLLSVAMKAGLLHPNCRHTLATWFEGISRLPKIYDEEEANKEYQAEQKQRTLENAIRKAKRQKAGATDKENKDKATKKVLALQKQLRQHLKAHPELKRNPYREKIHGTSKKIISELDNFDETTLQGVDKRTILEVDKALTKLYQEYPSLKGIVSDVKVIDKGTAVAELDIQNDGIKVTLGINKNLTPENAALLCKRMYDQYKWTKKPGIEGIIRHEMGHILNYDYYVRKNGLKYGIPYSDATLQKLIDDLEKNQFATELRRETFKKLGIADTDENVANYFSSYAKRKSMTKNGEFFAEAFSDYSDTNAKFIFMELLKERMK